MNMIWIGHVQDEVSIHNLPGNPFYLWILHVQEYYHQNPVNETNNKSNQIS